MSERGGLSFLGKQQVHVLSVAANATIGIPIYPQDRAQERVCDSLVKRGLLKLDGLKKKYVTPCYHITDGGRRIYNEVKPAS